MTSGNRTTSEGRKSFLALLCFLLSSHFLLAQATTELTEDGSTYTISYSGAAEDFLIPSSVSTPIITFVLTGGDGGGRNSCMGTGRGGEGAFIRLSFPVGTGDDELQPGGTIRFVVGGKGENQSSDNGGGAGGGAGSAILYHAPGADVTGATDPSLDIADADTDWVLLAVASGGGGAFGVEGGLFGDSCDEGSAKNGATGSTSTSGTSGGGNNSGGTNGNGGSAGSNFRDGGAGGGALSDGGPSGLGKRGRKGGVAGGSGGTGSTTRDALGGWGYGGGGTGLEDTDGGGGGGGGGGGYSGGGGGNDGGASAQNGGGGGSYVNPAALQETVTLEERGTTSTSFEGEITYSFPSLTIDGSIVKLPLVTQEQDFIIPTNIDLDVVNTISFTARGADGGRARESFYLGGGRRASGGEGALVTASFALGDGIFELEPGGTIRYVVGHAGASLAASNRHGGGGGGGTAVLYRPPGVTGNGDCAIGNGTLPTPSLDLTQDCWIVLLVAGGGGGAYLSMDNGTDGLDANTGPNGTSKGGDNDGDGGTNGGPGGEATGNGGNTIYAGGGGGYRPISSTPPNARGGQGVFQGAEGGTSNNNFRAGGWGYGGGGSGRIERNNNGIRGGGGGGGFSGGGGGRSDPGGGGGSWVNSEALSSTIEIPGSTNESLDGCLSYQFSFVEESGVVAQCVSTVQVYIDGDQDYTLRPNEVDAGSYDADDANAILDVFFCVPDGVNEPLCGVSGLGFDCDDIGDVYDETYAFLEVTNEAGESDFCTFIIEVVRGDVEELTCPPAQEITLEVMGCDATILDGNPGSNRLNLQPDIRPTCDDQLSYLIFNPDGTTNTDQASFNPNNGISSNDFSIGTSLVVYTSTYLNEEGVEETQTCSFEVTLVPEAGPYDITCPSNITENTGFGDCTESISTNSLEVEYDGPGDITYEIVGPGDNPTIVTGAGQIPTTEFEIGASTITYTASCDGEVYASCSFTVTINSSDMEPPVIDCVNTTSSSRLDLSVGAEVCDQDIIDQVVISATDNCLVAGFEVEFRFDAEINCDDVGANREVQITVFDGAGNVDVCREDVVIVDDLGVRCPENVVVDIDPGTCSATVDASLLAPKSLYLCQGDLDYRVTFNDNGLFTFVDTGVDEIPTLNDLEAGITYTARYDADREDGMHSSFCNFSITVNDTEAPQAVCNTIIVNHTDDPATVAAAAGAGSTDNCEIVDYNLGDFELSCDNIGLHNVILTVADASGNEDNCVATIQVEDNTAPVFLFPCDGSLALTQTTDPGECTITFDESTLINVAAFATSDECGDFSVIGSIPFGTVIEEQSTIITLTAIDEYGNFSAPCDITLEREDFQAPEMICQNNTVILGPDGTGTLDLDDVVISVTDNCDTDLFVSFNAENLVTQRSYDCDDLGSGNRRIFAFDNDNNPAFCDVTITVVAPGLVVECEDVTVNLDANGEGTVTVDQVGPNSGSACSNGVLSFAPDATVTEFSYTCDDIGTTMVTLYVSDDNEDEGSCTATITIADNMPPTANCVSNLTIGLSESPLLASQIDNGSTDNCTATEDLTLFMLATDAGGAPLGTSYNLGCGVVGDLNLTLDVRDEENNVGSCDVTVVVVDDIPPTAICQDITVNIDNDLETITTGDINDGSSDNCGSVTLGLDRTEFGCADVGQMIDVTLSVSDGTNTSTCVGTVTVTDNTPPVANCQLGIVSLDENGEGNLLASDLDFSATPSSDVCGPLTFSFDQAGMVTSMDYDCADVGQFPITVYVSDVNGNTAPCVTSVLVEDQLAPNALCINGLTVGLSESPLLATDLDGGSNDNCTAPEDLTFIMALMIDDTGNPEDDFLFLGNSYDLSCSDIGDHTFLLGVTDEEGEGSSCEVTVSIVDDLAPIAICQDASASLDDAGEATITVDDIDNGSYLECGTVDLSFAPDAVVTELSLNCSDLGFSTVTLYVTDSDDPANTTSCMASVLTTDGATPIPNCQDATINIEANGTAELSVFDIENGSFAGCGLPTLSFSPSGPIVSELFYNCNDVDSFPVTMYVSNSGGNGPPVPCTVEVTVVDNIPPVAICQDLTVNIENDPETILTGDVDNGSNDNCGSVVLSLDRSDFGCADVGQMIEVTLSVNDGTNTRTCTSTVTVTDNTAPFVDCQAGIVNLDENGNGTLLASDLNDNNGSTDACGPLLFSFDEEGLITSLDFDCDDVGQTDDFVYATDANGNVSAPCPVTIFVNDNEAPVVNCTNISVSLDADGMASITAQQIGSATDNCAVATEMIDISEFDCDDLDSPVLVTYTAMDENSQSSSCSAEVTVEDEIAPTLTCIDRTYTIPNNGPDGMLGEVFFFDGALLESFVDNCSTSPGDEIPPESYIFESCEGVGVYDIVVERADEAGNVGSCISTVTIVEAAIPNARCQDVIVELDVDGNASLDVAEVDNGSNDECDFTISFAADTELLTIDYDCDDAGTTPEVTLYVTDESGNTGTCTATISVVDNSPPSVTCFPSMITRTFDVPSSGEVTVLASQVFQQASDNCPLTFSFDPTALVPSMSYGCEDIGAYTLQAYATDSGGNTETCVLNIRIGSEVAIFCNTEFTIPLSQGTLAVSDMVNDATDACFPDEDLMTCFRGVTINTGGNICTEKVLTCDDLGTNLYIATASNANGDASSCAVQVTVTDDVPPIALCQDITVTLTDGMVTITPEQIDNGSNDEGCGDVTLSLDETMFGCADVGDNQVVLTVTDENNNSSTCDATVTVDDEVPILVFELPDVCQFDMSIDGVLGGATPAGGVYSGTGVTDDGNGQTFSFTPDQLGDTEITYTYTTAGGCVFTTSTILTVVDCTPEITDPCACNDDASPIIFDPTTGTYDNPNDGTFNEVVTIMAGMGQEFRITAVSGGFGVNVGDIFTDAGGGDYTLSFDHADDVGYIITAFQFFGGVPIGDPLTISNVCAYPNPIFDPELDAIYCNFEESTPLGGTDTDGVGADAVSFTINGLPATTFDPEALGAGIYLIEMLYNGSADGNGGISPDGGTTVAFPGCNQLVETTVVVESLDVGCLADLNVTLDENCSATITPEMVLTGTFGCADEIVINVDESGSNVLFGCGDHTYEVQVFVANEMVYTCWGDLFAEDKTDPVVDCPDDIDEVTVEFDLQTLQGTLDGTEDLIELNDYSCFQSFFEPTDGEYLYDLIEFTVDPDLPADDIYNIQVATNGFGSNFAIFQGAFNADNPCENILGGSDGAYFVDPFFGINALLDQDFRITLPLQAGQTYTILIADGLADFGAGTDYVIGIVSDNGGTFSAPFSAPAPVEVSLPLYCEDLGLVQLLEPATYLVDANGATIPGSMSAELRDILDLTGRPDVSDNCGPVLVTVSDELTESGDCGDIIITRTFVVSDRADGVCIGTPRTDECTQIITLSRPTIADLIIPPFTATIECDEDFPTDGEVGGPDDNPHASVTGYPFLLTASGYVDLDDNYCNLGASYSDEPRIEVCEGTYSFRREWNLIDWCNPDDNTTWDQFVKVGDFTGPVISGISEVINISTSPLSCVANVAIPNPDVVDGNDCGS
ncbi:MAG: hypothetical protein AAFO03_07890, partial [Bacteroidota bacterium]